MMTRQDNTSDPIRAITEKLIGMDVMTGVKDGKPTVVVVLTGCETMEDAIALAQEVDDAITNHVLRRGGRAISDGTETKQ